MEDLFICIPDPLAGALAGTEDEGVFRIFLDDAADFPGHLCSGVLGTLPLGSIGESYGAS